MKSFSAPALAALASGDNIVSGAVRIGVEPNALRFWGGNGTLVIGSEAFIGVGDRGLVSVSAGTLGGQEAGAEVRLSGVDPDVVSGLDLRSLRGRPVVLWRLIFNGAGSQLLHAAVFLRGRLDRAPIEETPGGTSTIIIGVEGAARGLGRRSERMRTDGDQRLISPTDGGLRRISYAGEKSIHWGGKPPQRSGAAFGGSSFGSSGSVMNRALQEALAR